MCRVLVAHMIKTRILQHCKKIKHVGVLYLVLIRFFCFAPLPMRSFNPVRLTPFPMCSLNHYFMQRNT